MSGRALQPRTNICHLCSFLLRRKPFLRQSSLQSCSRTFISTRGAKLPISQISSRKISAAVSPTTSTLTGRKKRSKSPTEAELERVWKDVQNSCDQLLSSNNIPSEQQVLSTLSNCNALVELLAIDHPFPALEKNTGATSALLTLDEPNIAKKSPTHKVPSAIQRIVDELSNLSYAIVKHPPVFITPQVLDLYTRIQTNLGKPQTFPEVFHLYANKPVPQETSPIKYSKQNPNKVSNAIPVPIADGALQVAIDSKQLEVAMDIIECTYTTTAFHRAKFVRKCLLPAMGVAVAPVAAYTLASQYATFQTTMDPTMATNVAFAGILAYTFFTGTIGVVAITTANDQMDRVTWAPGIPLRERWMREEERAAIDKIAGSWGFRESWRRGEEEGNDWEGLREWIGGRGMILDRVELMEGME